MQSFTTDAAAPDVTTSAATSVTTSGATLNGTANPNGDDTTGWFRYSTTAPAPATTPSARARRPAAAPTSAPAHARSPLTADHGLTPATTYYYCAIASNTVGTSFGTVQSFTTDAAPPERDYERRDAGHGGTSAS